MSTDGERPGQGPDDQKREVARLIAVKTQKAKPEPDIEGAATALFNGGFKSVNRSALNTVKKYNVTSAHTEELQAALAKLREGGDADRKLEEARKKLQTARSDSSGVSITADGIEVHLDCDQLKHQPQSQPIGTRHKGGGTKFNSGASPAWHQENTLVHMRNWAQALRMAEGDVTQHGQAEPVNHICYEGFCVFVDKLKYVSFHCYPERDYSNRLP